MSKKKNIIMLFLTLFSISLSASTWKYAMGEGVNDPQGIYATAFKEYIEANSKHKIKIYPVGSLGEETDMMEQTQAGLLQFLGQSTGYMGGTIPEMDVFFVPYLMPTDTKELDKFFKTSKALNIMLPKIFAKHNLELLGVFPEGEQAVTTFEEFHSPSDLKGKKIRVMPGSPLLVETYKAFGASPVPMSWGDLIGALKTHMVDGQENPTVWIQAYGLDKLTKVLTYMGHNNFTAVAVANKKFYDKLSKKNKELVQKAAAYAHSVELKEAQKLDAYGLGMIIRTNPNYKIVTLTKKERVVFQKRASHVEKEFIKEAGERGKKILEQMKEDLKKVQKK
jgi:TRAP-type C4-dicarboxylate transport system substrate-binding protein